MYYFKTFRLLQKGIIICITFTALGKWVYNKAINNQTRCSDGTCFILQVDDYTTNCVFIHGDTDFIIDSLTNDTVLNILDFRRTAKQKYKINYQSINRIKV